MTRLLLISSVIATQTNIASTTIARAKEYALHTDLVPDEFLKELLALRTEVDHLYKTLSTRTPLIETPCAFQWAQNATHVLLHVKFTRRWNAPGALEVENLKVDFSSDHLSLSGEGGHSGNRYLYFLRLNVFGEVAIETARHNFASVGRLIVHLPKKIPNTRWPRLLADPSMKLDNMHFWMDMHNKFIDQLDQTAKAVKESPLTCTEGSFYCGISDRCVSDCGEACGPAKVLVAPEGRRLCVGVPTELPIVTGFTDLDPEVGRLSGELKLNFTGLSYDISAVRVFFGDALKGKVGAAIAEAPVGGSDILSIVATLPSESAMNFLVTFVNIYGESAEFATLAIKDFVAPPKPLNFGISAGEVAVTLVEDFAKRGISSVAVVFGKPEGCLRSKSISVVNVTEPVFKFQLPPGSRAPLSATHVLVFARTTLGDSLDCATFRLPAGVRGAPKTKASDISFETGQVKIATIAADESLDDFVIYEEKSANQRSQKLGLIGGRGGELNVEDTITKICVFARNLLGEADEGVCVATIKNTSEQETENEL
jgi:hypothetical protein